MKQPEWEDVIPEAAQDSLVETDECVDEFVVVAEHSNEVVYGPASSNDCELALTEMDPNESNGYEVRPYPMGTTPNEKKNHDYDAMHQILKEERDA